MDYGLPDILSALFRTRWRQSGDHRNTYAVEMCLRVHRSKANTAVYVSLSHKDKDHAGFCVSFNPYGPVAQSVRAHA